MTDDVQHDPGLPASAIVAKYGEEVRNAIAAGISTGTADVRKAFPWWVLAAILLSMLGAGAISWLVAAPRPPTTSVMYHHSDGVSEVCDRTADSGPPHSVFVCRLTP